MNFHHVRQHQFVGETTCYTGLRRMNQSEGTAGRTDSLVSLATNDGVIEANGSLTLIQSKPLPQLQSSRPSSTSNTRPKAKRKPLECVGYDEWKDNRVHVLMKAKRQTKAVKQPGLSTAAGTAAEDTATMDGSTNRVPSVDTTSAVSQSSTTAPSHLEDSPVAASVPPPLPPQAPEVWLMWSRTANDSHAVDTNDAVPAQTETNFRPLSPTLMQITTAAPESFNSGRHDSVPSSCRMVLWTGSADDCELRCYHLSDDDTSIESVHVSGATMLSPVMVLSVANDANGMLAVGCRDGTVQVLSLRMEHKDGGTESLSQFRINATCVKSVIVDGPIIGLHLNVYSRRSRWNDRQASLLVGSMCGYACQLIVDNNGLWKDPVMVTEDLESQQHHSDDAVMAVCSLDSGYIALGMFSGEVRVVMENISQQEDAPLQDRNRNTSHDRSNSTMIRSRNDGPPALYVLVWRCKLLYPVHSLAFDHHDRFLVVTTNKSIHLFEAKRLFSADKARALVRLLRRQSAMVNKDNEGEQSWDDTLSTSVWHAQQSRIVARRHRQKTDS